MTAAATTILAGQTLLFKAKVQGTGSFSSAVTWEVNGIQGGNALNGTINDGNYVAPNTAPSTDPVTITATSVADSTKSGTTTTTVFAIVITPADPTLSYGQTQQFTATVTGINNAVIQWTAAMGNINSSGFYTAPPLGTATKDTVWASVMGAAGSVSTTVTLQPVTPTLTSVSAGIVGQTVTIYGKGLYNITNVYFSLPGGVPVAASFNSISTTEIQATVPVGAATGPLFVQYTPCTPTGCTSTNSVTFTRLPNLHIRAQNAELTSGETTQFNWSVLGGSTSKAVSWSADQGTISSAGLYQAPAISAEGFATITACIAGTQACDAVMLHLLPLRISPRAPDVDLGGTVQLDAIQNGAMVSPTWSLPSADGAITSGGLFTAPITGSQGGPVAVNASLGTPADNASVAVTGGFPGLVNRVWDYVNFNQPGDLGMFAESVAVNGNYAYYLDLGAPFAPNLSYAAIDVYDITNPHQPAWVAAVDAMSNLPIYMFTYGNYLVLVDSGFTTPVPSRISIYNIQNPVPVLQSVANLPELAVSSVSGGIVYGFGQPAPTGSTTVPVYTFDIRSGTVIQNEYNLPPPSGAAGIVTSFLWITGSGNMIYASQGDPNGSGDGLALDAFDISTSPPSLVTWVPSGNAGFRIQAVNQLVFADFEVFDFSTTSPTIVGSFPMINVQSVQGNQVLALGSHLDYLVIDVSNPSMPVETEDVADIAVENPFFNPHAALGANNFFAADGQGGLAVFDISAPGGPVNEPPYPLYEEDAAQFSQIYDQVIQGTNLYAAGVNPSGGSGGMVTFDVSGSTPNPLGQLFYTSESGLAIQVSGTNAFLGLTDSLKVVDVSNASAPTEVASITLPTNALALSGTSLFVGTSDNRLVVLDVTNPTTPNQIGSVSIPGPPVNIRMAGSLLFVADGPQGLLIFDVSNASSPVLLSQLTLSSPVWDVAPSGTTALLAADALGLVVVDVSNPAQVSQLSATALPIFNPFPSIGTIGSITLATSIAIQGSLACIGTGTNDPEDAVAALAAFDFGTPTSPRLVAFRRQMFDDIAVVTPSGSDLFLADNGLIREFNSSSLRNSIEIYPPPAALAQSIASKRANGKSTAYLHSKLNRNWKPSSQRGHSFTRQKD